MMFIFYVGVDLVVWDKWSFYLRQLPTAPPVKNIYICLTLRKALRCLCSYNLCRWRFLHLHWILALRPASWKMPAWQKNLQICKVNHVDLRIKDLKSYMLCILNSKRVRRNLFPGENILFCATLLFIPRHKSTFGREPSFQSCVLECYCVFIF